MIQKFKIGFLCLCGLNVISLGSAQGINQTVSTPQEIEAVSLEVQHLPDKPKIIENLNQLCPEIYQREATCPKDFCRLFCLEGESGDQCTLSCEPRPCVELTVDHCPSDTCQVLDGCAEKSKHCYPKMTEEPATCGDLAYSGKLECCQGLVKRCGVEYFDGSCDMKAEFSIDAVPQCVPCGNGICNQFENKCNCPEDCGD